MSVQAESVYSYNLKRYFTDDELETLRICYESPSNEYDYLTFKEYIGKLDSLEDITVLRDMLEIY